jgi:hypothetical protein
MTTLKRVCVLLVFTVLTPASDLFAQWQTSLNAPYTITCVKFLQDEGTMLTPPIQNFHHGVVGGAQHISYCLSASNALWNAATIPTAWSDGYVTDFTFEDTLHGYAAIYGASANFYSDPSVSGILKTTDGGASWTFLIGAPVEVRGLYFNKQNGRLFASSADVDDGGGNGQYSGVWTSTNHGLTWARITVTSNPPPGASPYASRCNFTGFASWDGIHIVLATNGFPCVGEINPPNIPSWLYSKDGGLTWQASGMTAPSWQPLAVKSTNIFYASSNPGLGSSVIYVSSDNGKSWRPSASYSATNANLTEVMGGDACIIVASDSAAAGNYYSADDGMNWQTIGGSGEPHPPIDCRWYAGLDSIWMFQNNLLRSTLRPEPNPVHYIPKEINFVNSGCFTSDTTLSILGCEACDYTITKDSVILVSGSRNFTVTSGAFPQMLCSVDTLHISYTPTSEAYDTSKLRIYFHDNSNTSWTDSIMLYGGGKPSDFTTNFGSKQTPSVNTVILRTTPCERIDTFLSIFNATCTDIQLLSIDVSGDTGHIWLDKIVLPDTIAGRGGRVVIPIHALSAVVGSATQLQITIATKSSATVTTTKYKVTLFVTGAPIKPFVRGINVHVPFACHGIGFDTAIYYFDTTCLPVTINDIRIKFGLFALDLNKVPLPLTLQPFRNTGGTGAYYLRIPVRLNVTKPGIYIDSVIFNDVLSDGTSLRTGTELRYTIDKSIDYTPISLSPLTQNIPAITPCDTGQTFVFRFRVHDTCGFPDTLSSNIVSSLTPGYMILHLPTPETTLLNGQIDSVVIGWPSGYAVPGPTQQGFVKLTFRNGTDSSSMTYRFSGYVVPCNAAEVNEAASSQITIHLSGNQLAVSIPDDWPSAKFELQNVLGETMLLSTVSGSANIDTTSLASGVYFYRVTAGGRVMSGKVMKP